MHKDVHADHVTLMFDVQPEDLDEVYEGERVPIRIVGAAEDDKAQAAAVVLPQAYQQLVWKPIPHITVSTAPGVDPAYSSDLLAGGIRRAPRVVVFGIVRIQGAS